MIEKATYELEWIQRLFGELGKRGDPKILEKVIHAFTLLEQLKIEDPEYSKLNKLKKSIPEAFFYWYQAITVPVKEDNT